MVKWRIVVSTCRHDTVHVRRLARELALSLHAARRVNRGGRSLQELLAMAKSMDAQRLVIIYRGLRGNPGRIVAWDLTCEPFRRLPVAVYLSGVAFSGARRIPRAESEVCVVSVKRESDFAADLAALLNLNYLGLFSVEELLNAAGRLMVVEPVEAANFSFVVKFYEKGSAVGPKLFVKSVRRLPVRA